MENKKQWYVVVTKPRAERKVAERLLQMDIEAFCPTRIERRQWSDRVKKIEVSLLPSMVLVNLEPKDRDHVFQVQGVLRYLFFLGKPAHVRDEEIEALREVVEKGSNILEVRSISPGDKIEVPGFGSLPQKGIVRQVSGNKCWVVLEQLGYVVTLQL